MSNEAKVEMVPMLQDMRTYITNHYWSEMLCEVEEQLPGFKAQMPSCTQGTRLFLHHEESKIVKADFWRKSRTKMSADLYVRLKIGASKNGELPRYFVQNMYLSTDFVLDGTIQWLSESTVLLDECPEREGWTKLSKYLVPIFSYDDMELQVQNMLKAYLGEIAVTAYQSRAAWKLAKAMELQISSAPLFKNRRTEAILFFQEGIARAERQEGDETVMEEMVIPAKTILLNSNAKSYQRADSDGREIFHECIHYEWHTMFFTLQALHSADLRLLEYGEADRASRPAAKDVRWVERQASYGSTAAALPRPVLMPMVHQYWAEVTNQSINPGDKIAHVIYQIAQEKQVSKGLIRTRLIWLGSPAAKGAFNYVNGRYIANFAFDRESVSSGDTFVISRTQFLDLYEQKEDFRELIDKKRYVYADGHVCLNTPSIVRQENKRGAVLTEWARGHVDVCCLKFHREYKSVIGSYGVGELHSDQAYQDSYTLICSLDLDENLSEEALDEKNAEYLETFPRRPSAALVQLIHDRCGTQKELSLRSGISEATISRMCSDDSFRYDIRQITRIVISLHMPPLLSAAFMELTGFGTAVMTRYLRYQCIIACMFMDELDDVINSNRKLLE